MTKGFWDERYAMPEFIYGQAPNTFFKDQISLLKPGKLLLPCEGEGRNAVFAASQGWEVSAFDQSFEALKKAEQLAEMHDVDIHFAVGDALGLDYEDRSFDAVGLIFSHFVETERKLLHANVLRWLKPGGVVILEAFNPKQLNNGSGGPKDTHMLYTPEQLAADFSACDIQLLEEAQTVLDEGRFHQGLADVIRLLAVKR